MIERLPRYFKKEVMKNKYYSDYAEYKNAVDAIFKKFKDRIEDVKSLLNFKFGIIEGN